MQDRQNPPADSAISPELLQQGSAQLEAEIKLIEAWLAELEEASQDNPETVAARKSYTDMLESRRNLLLHLQRQSQSHS